MPSSSRQTRRRARLWGPPAATLAGLVFATAAVPTPSPALGQETIDRGTFSLSRKGVPIGEEKFLIRQDPAGDAGPLYRSAAELNLKIEGSAMRVIVELETIGPRYIPRRYRAELSGPHAVSIAVALQRDRLRLDVRSQGGEEMREFLARDALAILDQNVAHHYFFLAKVLGERRSRQASIVIPQTRSQHRVTIEDRGEESVRIDQRQLTLRHLVASVPGGAIHHIWLQGDKVIRVEVPDLEFVAIRTEDAS